MEEEPYLGDGVAVRLPVGTFDVDKGPFLQRIEQTAQLRPDDLKVPGVARTMEGPGWVFP